MSKTWSGIAATEIGEWLIEKQDTSGFLNVYAHKRSHS